jgi:hypothetical protein
VSASQLGTAIKQAFGYDIPVQVWSCEDRAVMVGILNDLARQRLN